MLNFLVFTLIIALAAQGWNMLGGYGGQFSFGHAAFFGTGAYVTAILQARYGINAWAALRSASPAARSLALVIGSLAFRSGLSGSYFALITLAFAEVLRILANAAPVTGAGGGTLIKLDLRPEALPVPEPRAFFWIALALVAVSLVIVAVIEHSRFGAQLVAVRENEDAARALGVDALRVKLAAITLSAAMTAAGGCFYAQYFLFVDAGIAYGAWISVEALLAPIIGGIGTVFGPLLGRARVRTLGESHQARRRRRARHRPRRLRHPLMLVVAFAPRGIAGLLSDCAPAPVTTASATGAHA